MPDETEPDDLEELALRKCPVPYGPVQPFVGRTRDIARLRERLATDHLAIIKASSPGIGSTRLAAEYAHATPPEYPGGVAWVRHSRSTPKEVAADIVEALKLPTSTWLHWPFVGGEQARATMWRGLAVRPRTLVIIEGWPSWADPADWKPTSDGPHVLAIADAATPIEERELFAIGPLDDSAVTDAFRQVLGGRAEEAAATLSKLVIGDSLAFAIALARLRPIHGDGVARYASSFGRAATSDAVVVEAFESLDRAARTCLMIMACLDPSPVLRAICARAAVAGNAGHETSGGAWVDDALAELVTRGLVVRTVLGDPSAHARTLRIVREREAATLQSLCEPIAATIADELRLLGREQLHKARRLAAHAHHAACILEALLPAASYDHLLASIASCHRPFEAGEAARKRVALVRTIELSPGPRTLEALTVLGHALSERRELVDAQSALREALGVAETIHGADALEVASVIDRLSRAIGLGSCGESPPEKLDLVGRALSIRERAWGPDDPRLFGDLNSLGLEFAVAGRHTEALALFERARRIAERERPGSPALARCLEVVAPTLGRLGRTDEALASIDRALDVRRRITPRYASVTLGCAEEFLASAGRYTDLLARIDRVLAWPELEGREGDSDLAQTIARLRALRARTLAALGRREAASGEAEAALRTLEPLLGPGDRRVVALRALLEES